MPSYRLSFGKAPAKSLLLTIAFITMFVLVGCGGGEVSTPVPQNTAAPTSAATEEAASVAETAVETESPAPDTPVAETTDAAPTESAASDATAESASTEESAASSSDTTETSDSAADSDVTIARISFPSSVARSGPATSFSAVLNVSVNQEFPVVAKTGEGSGLWYLVELPDGQQAWLWSRVVTLVPEDAEVPVAESVPSS